MNILVTPKNQDIQYATSNCVYHKQHTFSTPSIISACISSPGVLKSNTANQYSS